ncbi:hypothetical protein [Streptomyces chromofuscus]|uniref:Uncharacterized protein n=1 Tax=Streptomyces chromofuscus TaxID=42881 RepID=A0A7M2T380_STRCW|nr:hypothetical protein [Streptomyces chromofuscus]QOV41961.1 hypothetical protein IPT68_18925 [Streptomyces chromofuscus]GGS86881.1 hypothetical protein GCM10010254_03360 [Streptomyces chromofuscus]
MQPSDEVLDAALAAPERTPVHSTRLGGKDLGPQVQSWKVERAYNTDLPEAMRAFSGSAAAQFEAQLAGADGVPAPRLYSAWAGRATGDAVRPSQSVVHKTGVSGHTLPAFRGTVRSRTAASGSDTVTIQALDGAERLRGPASLPRPYHGVLTGRRVATAVWCVDELLRQGGIDTCPPPRAPLADTDDTAPFTVLYASLHGGVNASYGQPENVPWVGDYDWIRDGAPFEMALMPKAAGLNASWMPRSRFLTPGDVFQVECWVNTAMTRGNKIELKAVFDRSGGAYGFVSGVFDISTGQVSIHSGTLNGTSTYFYWTSSKLAALRGTWHLGFMVDTRSSGSSVFPTVQPRMTGPDGSYFVGGMATFTDPAASQPRAELYRVDMTTDMAVECLQVTDRVWTDTATYPTAEWEQRDKWIKGAVLDDADLPLYDIPKVSGSQWDVITEIARASMSTAEFDEQGIFHWRGPARFGTVPTEPDLTVTTRRDIASLTISEEIDACRNHCEQPYKDWSGVSSAAGAVVDDTVIRELKPGIPVEVPYAMAEDEYDIGPLVTVDDSVVNNGHRVRFGTLATGGTAVKGVVTVSCRREGPSYIARFTNTGTTSLWTVTSDGKPSVRVVPQKATGEAKQRNWAWWNTTSQQYYGKQQFTAPASDWVQNSATASTLSKTMLNAGRYPVPVLGEVEVLHDPRIQLGDVVRVVDTSGAQLDTLAWVVGMRTSFTAGSAPQQTLTLRGTSYNGVPLDADLTPDGPLDPAYGTQRLYAQVTAQYATLADLMAGEPHYRALLTATGGA